MNEERKRVFFAFETHAPWPEKLPSGRLLRENDRHLTLAFLGWVDDYKKLVARLDSFPKPPIKVGSAGLFDKCIFLPEGHPRVVAWHVQWLENIAPIEKYQTDFVNWLLQQGFYPDTRHKEFLPHVTLSRAPFDPHHWKRAFSVLPFFIKDIHLYESVGNLIYEPKWSWPLIAPFEEIDHTADVAFNVHAESLEQLQGHALLALAFKSPGLLEYRHLLQKPDSLEDIVFNLNRVVAETDHEKGCSFKAVSYHGDVVIENEILTWEMIVDV